MEKEIINQLIQRRKEANVSQEGLSELTGIGISTIKRIEIGKGNPTLSTLAKICDVLGFEIILQVKSIES